MSEAGVTEHMQYYPFGSVRAGHVSTDRGFTGQRREGGSRLGAYFYNARFYATGLGHFLSADTATTDGLDRYAYVRFNPMLYTDPSGHDCGGGSPLDGILFNPCTMQPTAHSTPGCDDACGLAAVAQGCHNNPSAWFCPNSNGGGGPDSDPDPWCHHDAGCHAALQCLANGTCAPPAPSQTPVPDTADAGPLPVACGSNCPSVPIHPNSEARRQGACLLCPLGDKASTVAGHAYNIVTSDCFVGITEIGALGVVTFVAVSGGGEAVVLVAGTGSLVATSVGGTVLLATAAGYNAPADFVYDVGSFALSGIDDVVEGCGGAF